MGAGKTVRKGRGPERRGQGERGGAESEWQSWQPMGRLGIVSPSLCVSNSMLRFHPGPSASFPGSIKFAVSFVRPRCAVVLAGSLFRLPSRPPSCVLSWKARKSLLARRSLKPSSPLRYVHPFLSPCSGVLATLEFGIISLEMGGGGRHFKSPRCRPS